MGLFDTESKEDKMYKAIEGFEIHTSDLTVTRKVQKSEFLMEVGINSYDMIREMANKCRRNDYNGMVGLNISPSGGMGGAQAVIIYATAVKFE